MQNYQVKTIRYQTLLKQQGSAVIYAAVALLIIAGIYILFGLWGWRVVFGALIIAGVAGLAALEFATRQQQEEAGNVENREKQRSEIPSVANNKVPRSEVEHFISMEQDDRNEKISTLTDDVSSETPVEVPTLTLKQYRLELVNPGKEPVQVMRVLHNEFGFPADQAKRVILDQSFPLKLGQGDKDIMQERARALLKAGAKLRLVHCRSGNDGATAHINQHAV